METIHSTKEMLEAGLPNVLASPKNLGRLEMIVRRPEKTEREELLEGQLDGAHGLLGDNWLNRVLAGPRINIEEYIDTQLTLMNSRLVDLLAGEKDRWKLAGDQLYVDLDLSKENLPPGTHLSIGSAIVEVTAVPHTGCKKFVERYGLEAMLFINSPEGKSLRLRGMYAKVIKPGSIKVGDMIEKLVP